MQLRLQVPERLTGKNQQQLEALAFEALVVRLYALGELSSGEGAKLLGLTRREFLDLLGQYNVSLFDDEIDLKKEADYDRPPVVTNTTPLITLAGVGLLDLLPLLYDYASPVGCR